MEELLQDRIAKPGIASAGSLLSTWHRFHQEAFGCCIPTVDTLPVTVRSMVTIGAIFRRGGYRSFANYSSAIKAEHIEAGFVWTQLLAHTSGWVTLGGASIRFGTAFRVFLYELCPFDVPVI